ncbi:MAG: shikimate kinase [Bacteroidota bacterium]
MAIAFRAILLILPTLIAIAKTVKIFLIGFMAAGKSTVGRALADRLGFDLVDTDIVIEERMCKPLAEVVATRGEELFRSSESALLDEIIASDSSVNIVVACGGGMPCFGDNMAKMLTHGTVIYLQSSEEALFDRLLGDKQHRFLIRNKNADELSEYIRTTLALRSRYYCKADLIVANNGTAADCLADIMQQAELARLLR